MQNKMNLFFSSFLFCLVSCPILAAEFRTSAFEEFFKAVGGKTALENLKTIERIGEIEFIDHGQVSPKGKGHYRTSLIYPDKVRVHIDVGSYIYDELKNEKIYLSYAGGGFRELTDNTQKKQLDETGLKANRELLYWQNEHTNLQVTKETPIWTKNTDCLSGLKESKLEYVCFDKTTHLLAAAGSLEEHREYQDWKKIDGVKFPMRLIHFKKDLVSYKIKLSSLTINKVISAKNFELASGLK